MKVTKLANLLVIALALTMAASGCKKKPTPLINIPRGQTGGPADVGQGNPVGLGNGATGEGVTGTGGGGPVGQMNPADVEHWTPNTEIFKSDTVYFAFDSASVKTMEKAKVAAVAEAFKANVSPAAIRIEGHCDERGTEEYNRALGERRALALREALIDLGVDGAKVLTVSFGKDRPAADGHDESAWSKNRRGEFILLTPPK